MMLHAPVSKREVEDLLSASETALRKYNQNPQRVGCPPHSVLEQLANFSVDQLADCSEGKTPPDRGALFHILTECYQCYRELLELRAARKE